MKKVRSGVIVLVLLAAACGPSSTGGAAPRRVFLAEGVPLSAPPHLQKLTFIRYGVQFLAVDPPVGCRSVTTSAHSCRVRVRLRNFSNNASRDLSLGVWGYHEDHQGHGFNDTVTLVANDRRHTGGHVVRAPLRLAAGQSVVVMVQVAIPSGPREGEVGLEIRSPLDEDRFGRNYPFLKLPYYYGYPCASIFESDYYCE